MHPVPVSFATLFITLASFVAKAEGSDKPDEIPKSTLAVAAIAKHEKAIANVRETARRAIVEADQKLVRDLDGALSAAMQNKNADEVVRLTSAKRAAQASLKQHTDETAGADVSSVAGNQSIVGTWKIKYTNGFVRTYIVNANGEVSFPEDKLSGQLKVTKDGWLLDFGDGRLEILKFKLMIDHFNPKSNYPDKSPSVTGAAERANDEPRTTPK